MPSMATMSKGMLRCGTVVHNAEEASRGWRLRVEVPESLMPCVVPQGSITLHGVSLTVAHRDENFGRGGFDSRDVGTNESGAAAKSVTRFILRPMCCVEPWCKLFARWGWAQPLLADQSKCLGLVVFLTSFEHKQGQVVGLSGATQDGGTVQFKLIDQTCGVGVGPNLGQGSLHIGLCRLGHDSAIRNRRSAG